MILIPFFEHLRGGSSPLLGTKSRNETRLENRRLSLIFKGFFGAGFFSFPSRTPCAPLKNATKMPRRCHAGWLCVLLVLSGCSSNDWSRSDTAWQITYTVAIAADAYTTTRIRHTPGVYESEPITRAVLGAQPGTAETWQYFGTLAVSHYLIARALPKRWRRYWQVGGTGYHTYHAARNCEAWLCDPPPPPDWPHVDRCFNCPPPK